MKRLFRSSLFSVVRVVPSAYLRLLIFLPGILIPACASSSQAFHMMYSAYKLNKQGDNIQPWRAPLPRSDLESVHCSMSSSNCCFLTCLLVLLETGKVVWYSHLFKNFAQFDLMHIVRHSQWSRSRCFLEYPHFLCDPTDVGSLISGSSAFSKSSLYIWKLFVQVPLQPSLKDFEHYVASMWN